MLALGVDASPVRAVVQGAGSALRMGAAAFRRELERSPALHRLIDRYLFVHLCQLAQTAACTRFHLVEARLARWLLMTQDRAHSESFHVTQEFLALMLGVRRVGVTKAAGSLFAPQADRYSRGNVTVLDRRGLKAASCGCYKADCAFVRPHPGLDRARTRPGRPPAGRVDRNEKARLPGPVRKSMRTRSVERLDVRRLVALGPGGDVERHLLVLAQRLVTRRPRSPRSARTGPCRRRPA